MKNITPISLLAFFSPLYSLSPVFIVEWSIYKLVPIFIFAALITKKRLKKPTRINSEKYIFFLLGYMILLTLASAVFMKNTGLSFNDLKAEITFLRTYGHMAVQLSSMLMLVAFFYLTKYLLFPDDKYIEFINGFLFGVFLSSFLGIILYILAVFKFDLLELFGLRSYEISHSRIGGLSGEPRHLGSLIVASVLIFLLEPRCWFRKNLLRR